MLPVSNTVYTFGSLTAPGANTAILTIAAANILQGWYNLKIYGGYGATAEATNPDNFILFYNNASILGGFFLPFPSVVNSLNLITIDALFLAGVGSLQLRTIVAGSAGSVYVGALALTPIAYNG